MEITYTDIPHIGRAGTLSRNDQNNILVHDGNGDVSRTVSIPEVAAQHLRVLTLTKDDIVDLSAKLTAKVDVTDLGVRVLRLNEQGLIDESKLPLIYKDIYEYPSLDQLPLEGARGTLYVIVGEELVDGVLTKTTELYVWSGSKYACVCSKEKVNTDKLLEGSALFFTPERVRAAITAEGIIQFNPVTLSYDVVWPVNTVNGKVGDVTLTKEDVGLDKVENRSVWDGVDEKSTDYLTTGTMGALFARMGITKDATGWSLEQGYFTVGVTDMNGNRPTDDLGRSFVI